jgi:nitrogen fixation protein NifU and related proteins
MGELQDLYQQVILEHNRSPRNFRRVPDANRHADGDNPLCGDKIQLWAKVNGDVIEDVGFLGRGCAISQASASVMTTVVKGKTVAEAERVFAAFHAMVTGTAEPDRQALGTRLAAFAGVKEFPARVKCANLPWHTLHAALQGDAQDATGQTRATADPNAARPSPGEPRHHRVPGSRPAGEA